MTGGRPRLSDSPDVLLADAASMLRTVAQTVTVFSVAVAPSPDELDRVAGAVERLGMSVGRRMRKAAAILRASVTP